ncbi:MAG: hypothetical protein JXR23_11270 [Pontiellaceae bacterium]|nr:hypothetical protein [Pontiellaceae bacterium]
MMIILSEDWTLSSKFRVFNGALKAASPSLNPTSRRAGFCPEIAPISADLPDEHELEQIGTCEISEYLSNL